MEYRGNTNNAFTADAPLPCPFCGSTPKVNFIGNDHSKKRQVEILCSNAFCRALIIKAGIRESHEQVFRHTLAAWNKRVAANKEAAKAGE